MHKTSDGILLLDGMSASPGKITSLAEGLKALGRFDIQYFEKGRLVWEDVIDNLVVNIGKAYLLDNGMAGSSYTAAFYMGVTNASPTPASGDTMASHAGWTEFTAYSNATRIACAWAAASGASKALSSPLTFNINGAGGTAGGAFLTTNSTISGTTGTLFSCGAFSGGNQAVSNGGTLAISYTLNI